MAVYTDITQEQVSELFSNFDLSPVTGLKGITAGVENTNYFVYTEMDTFVLTIFEKRVNIDELPYFINAMNHISSKGISCPEVIADKNGNTLQDIAGKKCILISFLQGEDVEGRIDSNHTAEVGLTLAKMHNATADFNECRANALGLDGQAELYNKIADKLDDEYKTIISEEIEFQRQNEQTDLPVGAGHLDLFVDNVFFNPYTEKLSGVIDFYFMADDYYVYDLAITINAWCFKQFDKIDMDLVKSMLKAYEGIRPLSDGEKTALPNLLRLACLRFLLTRANDRIYTSAGANVVIKDPDEYKQKLLFARTITTGDLF